MFIIVFNILFIIYFFLMGSLQFFGLSATLFAYISVFLVSLFFLSYFLFERKLRINNFIKMNLFFAAAILISFLFNDSDISGLIYYLGYVAIPLFIYLLINSVKSKVNFEKLIRVVVVVQIPVLLLQFIFPNYINYSTESIAEIDRLFGTFPLKSDHFVGFFMLSNILFLLIKESKSVVDYVFLILSIIAIILLNSMSSKVLLVLLIAYYLFTFSDLPMKITLLFIAFVFAISCCFIFVENLSLLPDFLKFTDISRISKGDANRFQTVYYFLSNKLMVLGNGPASYYNPLVGKFTFNANFSQIIWSYFDLGIIGLVIVFLLPFSFYTMFQINNKIKRALLFLFITFSFFTTLLDQISFLLTLNIFAVMFEQREKGIRI